ncbi:kinetochore component CENP-S-domain-containing protein [Chlamydoabsidia padenii]|nr:kinetochore component CENP-S-domain-containing protein [Chlamydoabsidia padenii]
MSSTQRDQRRALRDQVHSVVTEIANAEGAQLGIRSGPEFIDSLAEVVFKQMETFGLDVENFASHGRRVAISMDDVMLCTRRNDRLNELLAMKRDTLSKKNTLDKHFR